MTAASKGDGAHHALPGIARPAPSPTRRSANARAGNRRAGRALWLSLSARRAAHAPRPGRGALRIRQIATSVRLRQRAEGHSVQPCRAGRAEAVGATAVTPLVTGATTWGALFSMFSENEPGLDAHARRPLTAPGQCIDWVLQGVADAGRCRGRLWRQRRRGSSANGRPGRRRTGGRGRGPTPRRGSARECRRTRRVRPPVPIASPPALLVPLIRPPLLPCSRYGHSRSSLTSSIRVSQT